MGRGWPSGKLDGRARRGRHAANPSSSRWTPRLVRALPKYTGVWRPARTCPGRVDRLRGRAAPARPGSPASRWVGNRPVRLRVMAWTRSSPALGAVRRALDRDHDTLLPVDEPGVDDAVADGPGQWYGPDAELGFDLVHQLQGCPTRTVALVDERDDGHAAAPADPVQLAGLGLDAPGAVDDHDRGVGRPQGPVGVLGEVGVARGVQQVERPRPVREPEHGRGDGDAALPLQLHPVAGGRPCLAPRLDRAGFLDGTREQQELLGQGGLARVGVADDGERATRRDLGRERAVDRRGPWP